MNPDLTTVVNPYSWSQVSNLLFLSQPLGVGFSYISVPSASTTVDTTQKAADAAWYVLQGLIGNLSAIAPRITTRDLHLWTER